jgi:lipoate-protein ligase B
MLRIYRLGRVSYLEGLKIQSEYRKEKYNGDDYLLLMEHNRTVITLGRKGSNENLLRSKKWYEEQGIEVFHVDRGGDVTLHGRGQIVGYLIFDLKKVGKDVNKFLRVVEESIIACCNNFNLCAYRKKGYPGVWVDEKKIAAIGMKVDKNFISYHGFAFNVNIDLSLFNLIIPCGIKEFGVTSLVKECGREYEMVDVEEALIESFSDFFEAFYE